MQTALVAGATGLVGKELINELISDERFEKVIVLSRRELAVSHPKLEVKLIDFDSLQDVNPEAKIDVCFCCLGTTQKKAGTDGRHKVDFEYVVELAKLCKRYNINTFFVVSAQGADSKSGISYSRSKGQMEDAVKALELGTTYLVRPALIYGKRDEFRFGEKVAFYLNTLLIPILIGKLRKFRPVSGTKIARCMVALSQKKQKGSFVIESDQILKY